MKQHIALIAGGYLLIAHAGAEELAGTWDGNISINGVPAMQATLVLTPNGTFTYTSISNAGTIMEERALSSGTYRLTGDRLERHLTNWEPKQRCRPQPMGCIVVRMPEYVTETVALDGDRLVLTSVGVSESVKAVFKRK
jgi:hypothetical protein